MRSKAQETRKPTNARDAEHEADEDANSQAWVVRAIQEIQAGRDRDHVQFGLIYQHYEPKCRRLLAELGLRTEVGDLAQEVMLRVYKGIGNFRLDSSFETWLRRITKNVALNAWRDRTTKKAKATNTSLDTLMGSDPELGSAIPEPRSPEPSPLEAVLGSERETELEALLLELPPKMRQSMLLYYVHGFKTPEIARLQSTSPHTVKKQLVDGRKRIRPHFSVFLELFGLVLLVFVLAA